MTGNEKEKAPQEYYLWGLNQLKKKYDEILSENRLDVEIYQLQPSLDIKRRTVFVNVRQIAVAQYLCIRIGEAEALQKRIQSLILGWSARIGRLAVLVETSLITDADAVGIVMTGMSSRLRLRTARINHSVLRDVIMVTDVTETSG